MQIFVRCGTGTTLTVSVDENASVEDLKAVIEDVGFIPAEIQWLSTGSKGLTTGSLNGLLEEADTVTMHIDVNGGMRAKWRKKRMRRLRRKRRKMRQRAR
mmetsp:Transcript_35099/g.35735  ORF Transcript_35099/g.35735 Transcript_35099/m.35735 type:complete len:100 (-) Transcript_35099:88-387(-)|eukprot:CAMPEP_0182428358 /NCGR_PEP_ID=MMETSP1167-20130531/22578_1 /TAXON_ID=2988 /ORGANISM="Mallomonas Sp, Strain CCMP3275" /LENGTH=99 /DNA_ID=CAMNT_0024611213 /DNA_START=121 /DNA_END=420 /DNA_ORIENTATION=+